MHRVSPFILAGALFLGACSETPAPVPTSTVSVEQTRTVSETTTATATATETPSASPDATPSPSGTPKASGTPAAADSSKLTPIPGAMAPKLTKVVKMKFKTDKGDIFMEVYPQAAPNAAKTFEALVKSGFYDNTPVFRIVPGFVAQFGINSDPKHVKKKDVNFTDDPSYFQLLPGTLAFAKSGVNHNSTQVFINYGDNTQLVNNGGFTAFAKITKGLEVANSFKPVGDPSMGVSQDDLWNDTQGTLKALPEKPAMIIKAEVIK